MIAAVGCAAALNLAVFGPLPDATDAAAAGGLDDGRLVRVGLEQARSDGWHAPPSLAPGALASACTFCSTA